MIIELMILLIAVGAGILFVAWTNSRRRNQDVQERREVADSTGKLKQELERTANEVIGRMENHITHLETMLEESERNRTQLEGRVLELKKLLKKTEGQSGEIRDLLARLDDAGAEVTSMQRKMDVVERKINLAMTTPLPVQQQPVTVPTMAPPMVAPMTSPILPNTPPIKPITPPTLNPISSIAVPQIVRSAPPVQPTQSTPPTQPAPPTQSTQPAQQSKPPQPKIEPAQPPQSDFDKILEKSINDQPAQEKLPPVKPVDSSPTKDDSIRQKLTEVSAQLAASSPEVTPLKKKAKSSRSARDIRKAALDAIREAEEISAGKSKSPANAAQEKISLERQIRTAGRRERKIETTDSSIIKEMLLSGMSVEEVARETGIGRGAIELAQQMARRQRERR